MAEPSLLQRLLVALITLVLVAAGAVFALAALCGVLVLLAVWGVRRVWARLTGRPVAPWVLRTDPLAVWRQAAAFRRGGLDAAPKAAARRGGVGQIRGADVTDVSPK